MSDQTLNQLDPQHPDNVRIRDAVRYAADTAYRARLQTAVTWACARPGSSEDENFRLRLLAILNGESLRSRLPKSFRDFAAELGVSARWLAIGAGEMLAPADDFSGRAGQAMVKRVARDGTPLDMARVQMMTGLSAPRWLEILQVRGDEPTDAELSGFARSLGVPLHWLLTGEGRMNAFTQFQEPPVGWFTFGHHVADSAPLEFSLELGADFMPMWERPVRVPVEAGA